MTDMELADEIERNGINGRNDFSIADREAIIAALRRAELAQTEIKGHMRIEDDLKVDLFKAQARVAELESILRLYQRGRHGWEKEGMVVGEWLQIQEQFDTAVTEALKSRP